MFNRVPVRESTATILRIASQSALGRKYEIKKLLIESLFGGVLLCEDAEGNEVAVKMSSNQLNNQQRSSKGETVCDNVRREVGVLQYLAYTSAIQEKKIECQKFGSLDPQGNEQISQLSSFDSGYQLGGFIESIETPTHHYLVCRYAVHGDLHDYVTRNGAFTEDRARNLFLQMCLAVKYLHSHQMTHNDLSMENIAFDDHDQIMMIDFGSASMHPYAHDAQYFSQFPSSINFAHDVYQKLPKSWMHFPVRGNGARCGKRGYQSPEMQYDRHHDCVYDAYSNDVFALGVILYTMLTAHPPFNQARSGDAWYNYISNGLWLDAENMKKQLESKNGCIYAKLSKAALNLIDGILKPAVKRLTLDDILEHPWLHGQSEMLPTSFSSTCLPSRSPTPQLNLNNSCAPSPCEVHPEVNPLTPKKSFEQISEMKCEAEDGMNVPIIHCDEQTQPQAEPELVHSVDVLAKAATSTKIPSAGIHFRRQSSYIESETSLNCDRVLSPSSNGTLAGLYPQPDLYSAHFNS